MSAHSTSRHALVFGASGLVGRHLVLTLARAGAEVTAAVRSVDSGTRVVQWLDEHGLTGTIATVTVDFDAPHVLVGDLSAIETVTEIYNCAGSYRFGMTAPEARAANVGIVERVVDIAAGLPRVQRVVHISGYRVGGQDPASTPWTDDYRDDLYAKLGAYEASKVESDAIFQARAQQCGVPWTVINPSSVIGDSVTGESDQHIGLATSIEQIWQGTAAALPGNDTTFVPVITVDYLAAFTAEAAIDPAAVGQSYWVLDDHTPPLPDLLAHLGRHLGVRVPRLRIPVALIKRLPRRMTHADPETLSFLSADRYPTESATELADRRGLLMPDVVTSAERWVEHLTAHRFGTAQADGRRFTTAAGIATFQLGDPDSRHLIFPGLPVNADTWAHVASGIGARVVDLPGLGLSAGNGIDDWERWLSDLLRDGPVDLIGHSIGAAAAVTAVDHPRTHVASLTLIAPFFLQRRPGLAARQRTVMHAYLRRTNPNALSRKLTGSDASSTALESSVNDLRRNTAGAAAGHLALAASTRWRNELCAALDRFDGPIRIITGTDDPLTVDVAERLRRAPNVELLTVAGAGHHPQLTHSRELVALLETTHT